MTDTQPQPGQDATPTQDDAELARLVVEAANIVTCDGYYELDLGKVCEAIARHRIATRQPAPATDELAKPLDHWTVKALDKGILALIEAGNTLCFQAETSGGTAGRDDLLMASISKWEAECDKQKQVRAIVRYEGNDYPIGAGVLATDPTSPATDELADREAFIERLHTIDQSDGLTYQAIADLFFALRQSPPAPTETAVFRSMDNSGFSKEFVEAHTPLALDPYTLGQAIKVVEGAKQKYTLWVRMILDQLAAAIRALIPTSEGDAK